MIRKTQNKVYHYVKSFRIRSFFGPYFPAFGLNTDQKNSEYRNISRSVCVRILSKLIFRDLANFLKNSYEKLTLEYPQGPLQRIPHCGFDNTICIRDSV